VTNHMRPHCSCSGAGTLARLVCSVSLEGVNSTPSKVLNRRLRLPDEDLSYQDRQPPSQELCILCP